MNCNRANELLIEYLYQELGETEVAPFEAHLQTCAQCTRRLGSIKATLEIVHRLPQHEPPTHLTNSLTKAAAEALRDRRVSVLERLRDSLRILLVHPAMTAAVTLVVVVGISFYAYQRTAPPDGRPEVPLPEVSYQPGTATNEPTDPSPGALETSVGRLSSELKNKEGDTTASISSTGPRKQAKQPLRAVANEEVDQSVVAKQTGRREAERQAPMDNLRHVGTRGLWNRGQGRVAKGYADDDGKPARKRRRSAALPKARKPARVAARPAPPAAAPDSTRAVDESAKDDRQDSQASRYRKLAESAMTAGRCEEALRHYNSALSRDPSLSPVIAANVKRCAGVLGRGGEAELLKARKRFPLLAGYFEGEIQRVRSDRGKATAAKRASRKAKAKPAAPATVDAYSK